MRIKLVENYSTDIQDILKLSNSKNACFISNWDKEESILNINPDLIDKSILNKEHINTYIMSKGLDKLKETIVDYLSDQNFKISKDYITIVSNGTSAAYISILQLFKCNAQNFLCIGPIYFTYMHLFDIFHKKLYYYNINLFNNINIDFNELKSELKYNNIDSIILIQPFFSSGINLEKSILENLIQMCEELHIYLLIDYVYGNMSWNEPTHIHNKKLIKLVTNSNYCILFESISKRIFLNGIKNSIIFSSSKFINNINIDSEICLGSISYIQESLLNTIYSSNNIQYINNHITNSLNYVSNNYKLLQTLLLNTDVSLCNSTCGYFTLMAIPKKYFKHDADKYIMNELYKKTNVVTIPHSRYYYNSSDYYCFRINLATDTHTLLEAVEKILHICSNSTYNNFCHIF